MNRALLLPVLILLASPVMAQPAQENLFAKAKAVLATIDGELALPGLKDKVEILRDRWGIPHIYALNADDLFFAQGFVAAQDRLFQIDWWWRVANGETAEVLGPEAVEGDRFARLIQYRGDLDAEWASYSPDTKQIATAFTNGINAYVDHIGQKLPIEFQVLGYASKPWRPEDILGRMSGIIMSSNFQREIMRAKLVAAVGVEKARLLAPTDPPVAYAPDADVDLSLIGDKILAGFNAATKALKFAPSTTASNNWVIAGSLSASGKPMLASDPHRAITLPSLRYLVHLHAPGWNVIGAGEPGLPGVAIGHNERIAWGFTIVGTDQADIFVEKTHPENPLLYKVGERWEKMEIVHEKVRVKGKAHAQAVELRYTRHGPVLYQDDKNQRAYALKWAGSEPGGAAYLGSLAVGRAQNQTEFLKALASWKIPGLNFVYADKDNNIGWVAAALTPIRKSGDGLLPVPGDSGKYDWLGYLPVKDLPQSFNPAIKFLATANHNILPPGYQKQIAYEWASSYRIDTIRQGLMAKKRFNHDDFCKLQHSNLSQPGLALGRLIKQVNFKDSALAAQAKILADWDGVLATQSHAGVIYAYWLQELQDSLFGRHVKKELVPVLKSLSGLPVMLTALEKPGSPWFGDNALAERDELLRATFARAIKKAKLSTEQSNPIRWGQLHTVTFRHPLESLGKTYAKTLNIGPYERPGDGNCPNNTRYDDDFKQIHGATYRHVLDLADWDQGLATSAPGQSGQFASPHYADLAPLWAKGEYFPLNFSRAKVEDVTRNRLILKPAPPR